jgi:hypothetical protein
VSVTERRSLVRAASIAAPLAGLARASARGRVLAAFERSAYLDLEGRVIALLWPGLGRGPFAISLSDPTPLDANPPQAPAHLAAGHLSAGPVTVDLAGAAVWDPALATVAAGAKIVAPAVMLPQRHSVVEALARLAPQESIAAIVATSLPRFAGAHALLLATLEHGLEAVRAYIGGRAGPGDLAAAVEAQIAGRGPGLTPSGDDLLVGIMHALTVWPALADRHRAADLRTLLRDAGAPRTTRISRAYLEAAADGMATEPWHELVGSLAADVGRIGQAVAALLRVGETSGADALTGFCWAWEQLAAKGLRGAPEGARA